MTDDAPLLDPDPPAYVERHRVDAAARESQGSVVRDGEGRWTIVGHAAVTQSLREIDTFVGAIGGEGASDDERILQWVPEPRHTQMRRAILAPIAPTRLRTIESFVRDLSRRLIADALSAGRVDLVAALADPVPTQTLTALFGVPAGDAARFQRLSDELLERQAQVAAGTALQAIHPEFADYVDGLVSERRAGLRGARVDGDDADDIVTALLGARVDGEGLSDVAVRTQVMMLIIAGSETTRNLLGNLLARLAVEPDLYARLRASDDPALADRVVEESLRRDPPVQLLMRRCAHATELDGTAVAQGDAAVVRIAAANRDPAVFAAAVASMEPIADRPVTYHDVVWAHGPASFWVELR